MGTVIVRASQLGNQQYYPASEEQSFDVELPPGLQDEEAVPGWPNPATFVIFIKGRMKMINLFDALGRKIRSTTEAQLDVSSLPRGMYIPNIQGSDEIVPNM